MLHIIRDLNDPLLDLVRDDPVRPSIPTQARVHDHAEIFVLLEGSEPQAVTCVAYLDSVPRSETELGKQGNSVAAFYTIWSYRAGAGRTLIELARQDIEQRQRALRYVTLSPKTETARRFHLRNGARVLQENTESVNYEY